MRLDFIGPIIEDHLEKFREQIDGLPEATQQMADDIKKVVALLEQILERLNQSTS